MLRIPFVILVLILFKTPSFATRAKEKCTKVEIVGVVYADEDGAFIKVHSGTQSEITLRVNVQQIAAVLPYLNKYITAELELEEPLQYYLGKVKYIKSIHLNLPDAFKKQNTNYRCM